MAGAAAFVYPNEDDSDFQYNGSFSLLHENTGLNLTLSAGMVERDNREEGPQKGLFSGSEGEFVIFRKADEPESDDRTGKGSEKTADDLESKNGEGEKGKDQER